MSIKKTPEGIYAEYTAARSYDEIIGLFDTVKQNENFFVGNQWEGVNAPDLDKPVMNVLKRVVNFFLASIVSDDVTAKISTKNLAEGADILINATNQQFGEIVEHANIKAKNRDVIRNAAVDGDGCMHFYYEEKPKEAGDNALKALEGSGCIEAEVIDNTDVYFGNPQLTDLQAQPYILIAYRKMLDEVKARVSEELANDIVADEDETRMRENESGKVTVIRKYWKENGTVWCMEVASKAVIMKPVNLEYTLYPIAYISWDKIKNNYHGQAAITGLIPNQIFINKTFAMAMEHIKKSAFPTVIYDKTKIPGGWVNKVGAAIGVAGNPAEAIAANFRPADMSAQVMQLIDSTINYTRDTMGASDASLGNVKPENTSAIIAIQKASSMPLELQKLEFYRFVEDYMRIFLDIMAVKYGKRLEILDGQEYLVNYDGLKELNVKLAIDVGASAYWSELMQVQTIDALFDRGIIPSKSLYLDSIPQGYVPNKQNILAAVEKLELAEQEALANGLPNMQGGEQSVWFNQT